MSEGESFQPPEDLEGSLELDMLNMNAVDVSTRTIDAALANDPRDPSGAADRLSHELFNTARSYEQSKPALAKTLEIAALAEGTSSPNLGFAQDCATKLTKHFSASEKVAFPQFAENLAGVRRAQMGMPTNPEEMANKVLGMVQGILSHADSLEKRDGESTNALRLAVLTRAASNGSGPLVRNFALQELRSRFVKAA